MIYYKRYTGKLLPQKTAEQQLGPMDAPFRGQNPL